MTDKKQNEQTDELRDLDVRDEQAGAVKGGYTFTDVMVESFKPKPKDPASGGSS